MCVLFYLSFVIVSAYASVYFKTTIIKQNMKIILFQNNIHMSEVHCGSAVRFGQVLPERFLFSRIWSSTQDHAVLVLLLNLVGFFISTWPRWSGGNILYHSCTRFEGASRGVQRLNSLTWFIGAGGLFQKSKYKVRKLLFTETWQGDVRTLNIRICHSEWHRPYWVLITRKSIKLSLELEWSVLLSIPLAVTCSQEFVIFCTGKKERVNMIRSNDYDELDPDLYCIRGTPLLTAPPCCQFCARIEKIVTRLAHQVQ